MSIDTAPELDVPVMQYAADVELQHQVEQFLYFEARLLDEHRYDEWLKLMADDLRYEMPIRYNRLLREQHLESSQPGDLMTFEDNKFTLGRRVFRLDTGVAWAEDPPSRTRHIVTNVWVESIDGDEVSIQSNFLLYRNRGEVDVDIWVGRRADVLRRVGPGVFQIASRTITLDQATIISRNLSVFF